MNGPRKFRTKPIIVEAIQYRPDIPNCFAVAAFLAMDWRHKCDVAHPKESFPVPTLEGLREAHPDDWIIRNITGGFHVCEPDIFAATYRRQGRARRALRMVTRPDR